MSNPYFAMYTLEGDQAIADIVVQAKAQGWDWTRTLEELQDLSTIDGYEEAMDTAVRKIVYDRLGFTSNFMA